jgi:Putative transposase, YhgA-like
VESTERVREIIRQFPENGLKQVLTTPATLNELLTLAQTPMLSRIELSGMTVDPTTYVTAEFRHVSSDLVLTVPLRSSSLGRRGKRLLVTVLIELQMQPDRVMLLRVLDYLVQVWKHQVRQYGEKHRSLASVKLHPVLPLVLHTGSYRWERLGTLIDLMDDAEDFAPFTPTFKPLFVSLPDLTEADLETRGGGLGQVLALLKLRQARRMPFAQRLTETVTKLQELRGPERQRRLELLSYVEGLVYHSRGSSEHNALRERINAALRDDETRLEVEMVRRTMADVHREEGRLQGMLVANRRTLLDLLRLRYGAVPAAVEQTIQTTHDADRLTEWLHRFATATDLDSIGIVPPK